MAFSLRSILAAIVGTFALIVVSRNQRHSNGAGRFVKRICNIPSLWRQYRDGGALISRIGTGSPAEKAGLEIGDIIIRFAGNKVRNSAQLRTLVAASRRNAVSVEVMRNGRRKSFIVTITGAAPKQSPD
jgi:S1-C subfamily serine protease